MFRFLVQQLFEKRTGRRERIAARGVPEFLERRELLSAVTVQVETQRDATLYEADAGDVANGSGGFLIVGGEASDELSRRSLLAFDFGSTGIPQGSTVLDVTLTMHMSNGYGAASDIEVLRVTTDWGEGGSDPAGNEIDGASAQQFDATWLFSFFDGAAWTTPGGDFAAGASATTNVSDPGTYHWVGEGLIRDVQHWLDHPGENFGWLLLGDLVPGSVKSFDSRNSQNAALRPVLEITYETPVMPFVLEGRSWNDTNADGLRVPAAVSDLKLDYFQGKSRFNMYGGQEYWYRSATNQSWYFLTDNGALTRWDGQPRKLTGTVVASLDPRVHANPGALLYSPAAGSEAWLNGAQFQLIDKQGNLLQTVVSSDRDLNLDGQIDPEAERGWYRFAVDTAGDYIVRAVAPAGLTESASLTSQQAADAWQLKVSQGLQFTGNLYENVGFRGERWLKATEGWVYITPAGDVYKWSGRSGTATSPVLGTWIVNLGNAYYRDLSLIYAARNPQFALNAESTVAPLSSGFFQPLLINGRSFHDLNGDGIRNPEEFGTAAEASKPSGAPSGNFRWYRVSVPATATGPAQELYFYLSGTRLFYWNPESGSSFFTEVWGGATGSPESTLQAAFSVEPWLNDSVYQLLDERGYVLGQTSSRNLDLNGDQSINAAQESGWYSFTGLLPGRYSVREIQRTGWLATTPAAPSSLQLQAASLRQQLGFRAGARDWYNFGARNERWFQGQQDEWYFIVPGGTVFEWDRSSGGTRGPAQGKQIAQLSPSFYVNIGQLFQPQSSTVTLSQPVTTLNFGTLRVVDGLFAELQDELLGV